MTYINVCPPSILFFGVTFSNENRLRAAADAFLASRWTRQLFIVYLLVVVLFKTICKNWICMSRLIISFNYISISPVPCGSYWPIFYLRDWFIKINGERHSPFVVFVVSRVMLKTGNLLFHSSAKRSTLLMHLMTSSKETEKKRSMAHAIYTLYIS
jgi:hypothetical protein